MSQRVRRREFLTGSGRAALSLPLFPLVARTHAISQSSEVKNGASWDARIAELERVVPKLMQELGVPGVSIAIVKDAKLAWRRAFGVKNIVSKEPVDNDTVFEAASISKTVFAYATMKLCEKGVIALDTPLTKYSPKPFLEGDPRLELITARLVLSHRTGFQNWRSDSNPLKIHFKPGEKYAYSGEGYSYLQSVVTHLTRQPIEAFMKANLFVPFGMTSSGYVWNELFEKRAARPHDRQNKLWDNHKRTPEDAARFAAAGDLHTTPTDYAKFLIEVLDPKPVDAWRLNKASMKEMLRPQVKVDESRSWALGWQIYHDKSSDLFQHGGNNRGFHAFTSASVERKCGFIIMTNGENGWPMITTPALGDAMTSLMG